MVDDSELIGSLGLILLLFFIGMEISLQKLISNWKVSVIGTILQIIFSVVAVWVIGNFYY
jgi:CPA2 family monovalent cation:H+ antiporter-2